MPFPRLRFRLRTLLLAMVPPCASLAWVANEASLASERASVRAYADAHLPPGFAAAYVPANYVDPSFRIGWLRRKLGDFELSSLWLPNSMADEQDRIQRLFPEASVHVIRIRNWITERP